MHVIESLYGESVLINGKGTGKESHKLSPFLSHQHTSYRTPKAVICSHKEVCLL